ncbi:MAG: hypothetical protein HC842_08930 [Cytophagales bacterium]|nr:hypothetical protein [Cytophagales bacterium]
MLGNYRFVFFLFPLMMTLEAWSQLYIPLNQISVGAGLGANYTYSLPQAVAFPFVLSYERRVGYDWEVGGYLSYASAGGEQVAEALVGSHWVLGARVLYHYELPFPLLVKPYAGLLFGYRQAFYSSPAEAYRPQASPLAWGVFTGFRYFPLDFYGIYAEVGYGATYVTVGVCRRW